MECLLWDPHLVVRPSSFDRWIQVLEFDTRILGGETPINGGVRVIALLLPSPNPLLCLLKAGDAPSQALSSQHREFNLGHIQPTAMFGRVMDLQFLREPSCLLGIKDLIARRR